MRIIKKCAVGLAPIVLIASCISDNNNFDFGEHIAKAIGVTDYTVSVENNILNTKHYTIAGLAFNNLPDSVIEIPFDEIAAYSALKVVQTLDTEGVNNLDSVKISVTKLNHISERIYSFTEINRARAYMKKINRFIKSQGNDFYSYVDTNYINGVYIEKYLVAERLLTDSMDIILYKGFDFIYGKNGQKSVTKIWLERQNGERNLKYIYHISDLTGKIIHYEREII